MKQLSFEYETIPAGRWTRTEDIARIFCLAAAMALSMSGCGGSSGGGGDPGMPNTPGSGAVDGSSGGGGDPGMPNTPGSGAVDGSSGGGGDPGMPNTPGSEAGDGSSGGGGDAGMPNTPGSGAVDGSSGSGDADMSGSQTQPSGSPIFGIPSTLAEAAARSVPALGSVTQSTNVSGGTTQDRADLVHAANGDLILTVTRGNDPLWEFSTGGRNVTPLSHDAWEVDQNDPYRDDPLWPDGFLQFFELRDRNENAYALMLTSKQANLTPAPDADEYGEGEALPPAHDLEEQGTRTYADGTSEYYERYEGVGSYCVSSTGDCVVTNGTVTEGTVYLNEGAPASRVQSWDTTDTDYLTFGMWLRPPSTAGSRQPEVGVFVDGGRPFSESEFTALSGTATYAGIAIAYALGDSKDADAAPFLLPSSEGEHTAQLGGAVELTANFGNRTIDGTITLGGDYDNYDSPGEPAAPQPIVLNLGSAPIDVTAPGGFFTGDTASDGSSSVSGLSGKWGGQFYGAPGDGGRPPHAAGTFGAQREGFSVLGLFLGRDGADVNDFLPDDDDGFDSPVPVPAPPEPSMAPATQ